ncbi:cyclic nucleotide-binding/CBS domain-containing protein [Fundidesulfovibrio terrae]|uniref:CBS domain-containing protein n=1 Tax=Fundidesulfovibrio terrae TaxID=2922866 RepID=UPI001FAE82C5|nr:CBS domain-containing protein [Fundidesulfovibrio terrae]
MLLRDRAWDVMRTDNVCVRESDSLREVASSLRKAMKEQPDRACAVVLAEDGGFKGVITAWWLLLYMEQNALEDSLKLKAGHDFEARFRNVCRKCFSRRAGEVVERDVPVVKPQDPLAAVLEAMLSTRRRWAVVMEGGKVLGVIAAEDLFMQMDWDELEA